jgi:hypothetical protein
MVLPVLVAVKLTVPVPAVKVPLLTQFPDTLNVAEGAVRVPENIVKFPTIVAVVTPERLLPVIVSEPAADVKEIAAPPIEKISVKEPKLMLPDVADRVTVELPEMTDADAPMAIVRPAVK